MKKYSIGQQLAKYGRGQDSLLAHITPREAGMLKRMGGAGSRNPVTGLLEFADGGGGARGGEGPSDNAPGGDHDADPGAQADVGGQMDSTAGEENNAENSPDPGTGYGGTSDLTRAQQLEYSSYLTTPQIGTPEFDAAVAMGRTNAMSSPIGASVVGALAGLTGMAAGVPIAGVAGLADQLGTQHASNVNAATGGSIGGEGQADPSGAQQGPGGLLSPQPSGGLADTPDPGLAGFYYTNPNTGQVEQYQGGLLPWLQQPEATVPPAMTTPMPPQMPKQSGLLPAPMPPAMTTPMPGPGGPFLGPGSPQFRKGGPRNPLLDMPSLV